MSIRKPVFLGIICSMCCVSASLALETERLSSETTANIFVQRACHIHSEDPLDAQKTERAMLFLEAADSLSNGSPSVPVPEQMIRIGTENCFSSSSYINNLPSGLGRYLNSQSDLEVASAAVRCMLEQINTRSDREAVLTKLFQKYSSINPFFASDLSTQLGFLAVEKADMKSAEIAFSTAYALNPYNQQAFLKYQELTTNTEGAPSPSSQLVQMRAVLVANPYDLDTAIHYADTLMHLQLYQTAADVYAYIAKVHERLYPDQPLADTIIHSWLLCCYHGDHTETKCLEVAEAYRHPDRLDLMLEAISGKTMIKMGQIEKGRRLLESTAQKAEQFLSSEEMSQSVSPEHLAWFYSFIQEDPEKALAWSNQAFQESPDGKGVKEIFAYTLALNGQYDLAQQYAEPLDAKSPIVSLTLAMVELSKAQKRTALEKLRLVIEMSPESFMAEKADQLLKNNESDYIPSIDSIAIREALEKRYHSQIVPAFMKPSERYSAKLLFNGTDFLYGEDFQPRLIIENTSPDALVIGDEGFLGGSIRVDAVLEGGLNVQIPDLLETRFRPSLPVLPGRSLSLPLDLQRGRLRKLLMTYPQADTAIYFKVYLDSGMWPSGKVESQLKTKEPICARIHRKGIVLSRDFLLQRLNVLSKGKSGQKYQAASLFTGLLAEQEAIRLSQVDFKCVQVERALLEDAVRKILVDSDWKVRVHALDCLVSLSIPLSVDIIRDVSGNLNHEKWPVRLMAMYLLNRTQPGSFRKVLDWTAQHDGKALNRRMAIALGGREPTPEETK